jgi:hypothetical protein
MRLRTDRRDFGAIRPRGINVVARSECRAAVTAGDKGELFVRSWTIGPVLATFSLVILCNQATAADSEPALRCAAIGDDHERLACYDGLFRSPAASAPAAAGSAMVEAHGAAESRAAPVAAAAASPGADFGLTPAQKQSIEVAAAKASGVPEAQRVPSMPDSVTAKVATVAHRQTGELVVITDDGQVWVQIDTETKGRVKEGEEVTIRKASLGSYFLVTPNHILVRVRRVK